MKKFIAANNENILLEFYEGADNFKKPVPVKFSIGTINLLKSIRYPMKKNWFPIWVHIFCVDIMFCLLYIKNGERISYTPDTYLKEKMSFSLEGKNALITSELVNKAIQVDYDKVLKAFSDFGQKVKKVVINRNPEIASYYGWEILGNHPLKFVENSFRGRFKEIHSETQHLWFEELTDDEIYALMKLKLP